MTLRTYDGLTSDELDRVQSAKLQRLVDRLRDDRHHGPLLAHLPDRVTRDDIGLLPTSDKLAYIEDQAASAAMVVARYQDARDHAREGFFFSHLHASLSSSAPDNNHYICPTCCQYFARPD